MKTALASLLLFSSLSLFSQELPTDPAPGFAFSIGTRFTIKMVPVDSVHFNFSLVEFEPFKETIDTYETDSLFDEKGMEGTIEFYFCYGTHGITAKEKEKNMKILLLMKKRTDFNFNYKSDIQRLEGGEFEETSNVGTYSGAMGTEMWPYMVY